MRVVLDTNVIVAAFSARGLCAEVFEVRLMNHSIVLSKHILSEGEKKFISKIRLPRDIVQKIIDYLGEHAEIVNPEEIKESICRDKEDIPIVGTALSGNARFLITGDEGLLISKNYEEIEIVTPRGFWSRLK